MKKIITITFAIILVCSVTTQSIIHLSSKSEEVSEVQLQKVNFSEYSLTKDDHPHAHMDVIQLGEYYHYGTEAHTVSTEDGYILELHRFTGNKTNPSPIGKQPVFLMHGASSSSMDWVVSGPGKSLAFILADLGYDVWMGNARGNKYSRGHKNASISEAEYWDVSFHEIGKYDLPAIINHIIERTKYEKIIYIGHSQGSASFFTMMSERPEYNDKIMMMFALAPVAYLSHLSSPVYKTLAYLGPAIDVVFRLFGKYEFCPSSEFFKKFSSLICDDSHITQPICSNIMFIISGYTEELIDKELLPAILTHTFAGASTKQYVHLAQLVRADHFRQFDYGWLQNLKKYGSMSPPSYKFENIKVPVSLHYSDNDWLSNPIDVEKLRTKLPNVIGKFRVPHDKFNHLDFVYASKAKFLLYDKVIDIMKSQEKLNAK